MLKTAKYHLGCIALVVGLFVTLAPKAIAADQAWPVQLEMRVPFEPSAFPGAGQTHLFYEVYLTNFGPTPVDLRRIEVLDAQSRKPVAAYEGAQLDTMLQSLSAQVPGFTTKTRRQIAPGGSVIVFISVALAQGVHVPDRLVHRVVLADSQIEGAVIGTHATALRVLGPPLEGDNWTADDGPSNDEDNHHRRGIFLVNGRVTISRRYAIDWLKERNGKSYSGDSRDRRFPVPYGNPAVLAVADGRVIAARDGAPENVPGHNADFHPAVPLTMENDGGNMIALDLGGGRYAWYFHLQPGSVKVKRGDVVHGGQVLGLVGASGDAREPHLHFELTTSPTFLAGEGLPYLIDRYSIISGATVTGPRRAELPLDHMVVNFGPSAM